MIPILCKYDIERLGIDVKFKFYEPEELTEQQVEKLVESFKDANDSFDETVTGSHTGVI